MELKVREWSYKRPTVSFDEEGNLVIVLPRYERRDGRPGWTDATARDGRWMVVPLEGGLPPLMVHARAFLAREDYTPAQSGQGQDPEQLPF